MKKTILFLAWVISVVSTTVFAHPYNAGPLWNNPDAQNKCPAVCAAQGRNWDGQWWTTVEGSMSVCDCVSACGAIQAGPIWNNQDAQAKCQSTCASVDGQWDGNWWTTEPGKMSVCSCNDCH